MSPSLYCIELLDPIMSSPGQKHGGCGHLMAGFDTHSFCARCREKCKGPDPCVSKNDCHACNILTEDQRLQLSTPSYRIKKEKRESKKQGDTPQKSSDSSSLIDPSTVTVVGAVDDQGTLQSPGSSSGADKKKKDKKPAPEKPKSGKSKSTDPKPSKSSSDDRIDELDKKWADRFNRLEALLLANNRSRLSRLPKLHRPTPHQWVLLSRLPPSSDLQPTNRPSQICLVPAIQPFRDRLPANRLTPANRNVLPAQTCLVLTPRSSLLASRPTLRSTPADLQICLAPALL